jgi:L-ascorbate metabolism protein UlaG (beta-lactamase superfamily)
VKGSPQIFDWPGEYEKQGIRIIGYKSWHDKNQGAERGENIMFKIVAEDITVLHCGDLGEIPSDDFLETIGEVDILLIPVGGFYTIDAEEAVTLVKKIEPSIVIPMHYGDSKLNEKVFGKLADVSEFIKKIGVEATAPEPQLTVKKEDLTGEMKVVLMEISS